MGVRQFLVPLEAGLQQKQPGGLCSMRCLSLNLHAFLLVQAFGSEDPKSVHLPTTITFWQLRSVSIHLPLSRERKRERAQQEHSVLVRQALSLVSTILYRFHHLTIVNYERFRPSLCKIDSSPDRISCPKVVSSKHLRVLFTSLDLKITPLRLAVC